MSNELALKDLIMSSDIEAKSNKVRQDIGCLNEEIEVLMENLKVAAVRETNKGITGR